MTEDHYATLGVEPRSEAAAIRAAYLALMRRYHPDKNDSPAAVERVACHHRRLRGARRCRAAASLRLGPRRAAEAAAEAQRSWRGWGPRAVMVARRGAAAAGHGDGDAPVPVTPPPTAPAAPARSTRRSRSAPRRRRARLRSPAPRSRAGGAARRAAPPTTASAAASACAAARPAAATPRVAAAARAGADARRPRAQGRARASARAAKAKCRLVRPGAEAAICNDDNLSALDGNIVDLLQPVAGLRHGGQAGGVARCARQFPCPARGVSFGRLPARAPPRALARDGGDRGESSRASSDAVSDARAAACDALRRVARR